MRVTPVGMPHEMIRKDTGMGFTNNPTSGFSFQTRIGAVEEGNLSFSLENTQNKRNRTNQAPFVSSDDEFGSGVPQNALNLAGATNFYN